MSDINYMQAVEYMQMSDTSHQSVESTRDA